MARSFQQLGGRIRGSVPRGAFVGYVQLSRSGFRVVVYLSVHGKQYFLNIFISVGLFFVRHVEAFRVFVLINEKP